MANSQRGMNRVKMMRMVVITVGLLLFCYVERNSHKYSSCPSCSCDCVIKPTISLPLEIFNSSLPMADCGKDDGETQDEMKKDIIGLYSEEMRLHENVTSDSIERTNALIMGAKRTSSHYQKEAEKCNAGMETCEEARERAEVALIQHRKLTALWMTRAQQYGWKDKDKDKDDHHIIIDH